jgi:predicted permease
MRKIRASVLRLLGTIARSRREREMSEEFDAHLQLHVDDNIRAGMTPVEARRQALLKFGGLEAIKEQHRDRGGYPIVSHLLQDLRFAVRLLRKAPGFSVTAIVTIALAVGVNAAIFTVFNAAALQGLPVPAGNRLAAVTISFQGEGRRGVAGAPSMLSYQEYEAVRDQSRGFDGVLAYAGDFKPVTLGGAEPRPVLATLATCNYFDVLGIRPAAGRTLHAGDCAPGAPATAVLSHRLWQTAFAGDPTVVGRTVSLNRAPFVVVGVAQAGFTGTGLIAEDVYVPVSFQTTLNREQDLLSNANVSWLVVMGRMKAGASLASVRGDLAVIAARLSAAQSPLGAEAPGAKAAARTVRLTAGRATLSSMPEVQTLVLTIGGIILAAVTLVLLMACANIANLLLARASARRREIAVRMALGAGRRRLVQQLLTESLLLAAIGGFAGFLVASWTSRTVIRYLLGNLPAGVQALVFDPQPDWRVALYAVGLTTLTGLAFGLMPALQSTRRDLGVDFRDVTATDRRDSRKLQNTLVTLQVAVCLVLLLSAGLLARGLYRAQTIDPGINMSNVTVVGYDLPNSGYQPPAAAAFQRQVIERVAALPGVTAVAQSGEMPLSDSHTETRFGFPGSDRTMYFEFSPVTPSYFEVLHIPIVRGRNFTAAEVESEAALIVTESTARRLWPGVDPLGQALTLEKTTLPVVGVVRDAQVSRLGRTDEPYLFIPAGPAWQSRVRLLVAGAGSAPAAGPIRAAIASLDPQLAVEITRLEDNLEQWRAPSKLVAALSATLALLALVLACTGVFGTVAYAVSRRVREIGIRVALGAAHEDVLRLIVRQGMRPGSLFTIALVACYVPARRALRVEPTTALRTE